MQRLRTRSQFQAVLAGDKVASTPHFVLHRCGLQPALAETVPAPDASPSRPLAPLFAEPDVWIGAMVPKRWARRAVTRNAIKRQIYQVSARFESALPQAAHVVRLRMAFDRKQFVSATSDVLKTAVRNELDALFARGVPRIPGAAQAPAAVR